MSMQILAHYPAIFTLEHPSSKVQCLVNFAACDLCRDQCSSIGQFYGLGPNVSREAVTAPICGLSIAISAYIPSEEPRVVSSMGGKHRRSFDSARAEGRRTQRNWPLSSMAIVTE